MQALGCLLLSHLQKTEIYFVPARRDLGPWRLGKGCSAATQIQATQVFGVRSGRDVNAFDTAHDSNRRKPPVLSRQEMRKFAPR